MIDTRRRFLCQFGSLALLGLAGKSTAGDTKTPTGTAVPELKNFDTVMTEFLEAQKVPGASLAIARKNKLVYARGFGFADAEKREPAQPDSRFRIASVSKPITSVAILQLAEQKKLALDDKVLDHVKLKPHLADGMAVDPRWAKITLRHLLHHTGGWDRDKSYDPISITPRIAKALAIEYPVKPDDVCRYMMGQPLDFEPGERYAYSNLGYLLLGRVIESVTKTPYEEWVTKHTLAPLNIKGMQLGRALLEHRAKDEVRYYDSKSRSGPALYGKTSGNLPVTYGGSNLEAYEAHGGWIANATDLVRFAWAFDDPARCPILKKESLDVLWECPAGLPGHTAEGKQKPTFYGCGWNVRPGTAASPAFWHSGLIGGTSSLLLHRADGTTLAVLFNMDRNADGKVLSALIDPLLNAAAEEVTTWPKGEALE